MTAAEPAFPRPSVTTSFQRWHRQAVDVAGAGTVVCERPAGPREPISTVGSREGRLHGRGGRYDELQALFLMRLVRLTKLRDQLPAHGSRTDQRRALVEGAFR